MDVLAVTDFPDIRCKCLIQSAHEGNILVIPREGGYLVRLYVELAKLDIGERVANRNVTVEELIAKAQRILNPYKLEAKEVPWWSVYEIGQRLTDKFDDVPEEEIATRLPSVFIAGDACHTHSPKAGQGMNVSMQDAFNLGWKLVSVLQKRCPPSLLHTYSAERRADCKGTDRLRSRMGRNACLVTAKAARRDPAKTQSYFVRHGRYTAGTATHYSPSILTGGTTTSISLKDSLSESAFIPRRSSVSRMPSLSTSATSSRRMGAFGFSLLPDRMIRRPRAPPSGGCAIFSRRAADSPVRKYTRQGEDIDAVIDVRAVFQQAHRELAIEAMPALLLPRKGTLRPLRL